MKFNCILPTQLTKNHSRGGKKNRTHQEELADLSKGGDLATPWGSGRVNDKRLKSTPHFNPFHPPTAPRKLIKPPFLGDWIPLAQGQAGCFCCLERGQGGGGGWLGKRRMAITGGEWKPSPPLASRWWVVNTNSCCLQTCGGWAARTVSCCRQDQQFLEAITSLRSHAYLRIFFFFPSFFPPFEGSSWLTQRNHFECCWQKCCRKLCVVGGVFFLSLKRVVVLLCQYLEAGTVCSFCLK